MARGSRNTPTNGETTTESKPKKSAADVKKMIVARARKVIRKSVARLQAAEVRTSGNPEGNWELLKAYRAFDEELSKVANGQPAATEAA